MSSNSRVRNFAIVTAQLKMPSMMPPHVDVLSEVSEYGYFKFMKTVAREYI